MYKSTKHSIVLLLLISNIVYSFLYVFYDISNPILSVLFFIFGTIFIATSGILFNFNFFEKTFRFSIVFVSLIFILIASGLVTNQLGGILPISLFSILLSINIMLFVFYIIRYKLFQKMKAKIIIRHYINNLKNSIKSGIKNTTKPKIIQSLLIVGLVLGTAIFLVIAYNYNNIAYTEFGFSTVPPKVLYVNKTNTVEIFIFNRNPVAITYSIYALINDIRVSAVTITIKNNTKYIFNLTLIPNEEITWTKILFSLYQIKDKSLFYISEIYFWADIVTLYYVF